jgi:hypothetical protein
MTEPITYPQEFIDRLTERESPKLTREQAEALLKLLARATRAGCLPPFPDVLRLLDLIPPQPELEPGGGHD